MTQIPKACLINCDGEDSPLGHAVCIDKENMAGMEDVLGKLYSVKTHSRCAESQERFTSQKLSETLGEQTEQTLGTGTRSERQELRSSFRWSWENRRGVEWGGKEVQ